MSSVMGTTPGAAMAAGSRAAAYTVRAPRSTSSRASARPTPRPAPVTSATESATRITCPSFRRFPPTDRCATREATPPRAWQDDPVSSPRLEWAVASGIAAWAVARIAAADRYRPLERAAVPLLSLTPQVTAGAGLAALMLRGTGPSATAALAGAALASVVAPRAISRRQPATDGPVLRVLTVNLLFGRAAGGALVDLVRGTDADVLFLQELSDDA